MADAIDMRCVQEKVDSTLMTRLCTLIRRFSMLVSCLQSLCATKSENGVYGASQVFAVAIAAANASFHVAVDVRCTQKVSAYSLHARPDSTPEPV